MSNRLLVDNLTVYGDRREPLLHIEYLEGVPGECIGIHGPSGAGKSSLLYALAGLATHAIGKVLWGENNLVQLSADASAAFRRNHVGFIFQDFLLFEELNALGNATLAGTYASRQARTGIAANAIRALKRLGLGEIAGRSVENFSGGERQRVAVARALANDPGIILADEPTASLDREAADRLIGDLVDLVRKDGKTLIAVSHDPTLLERMDRTVELRDGRIVDNAAPVAAHA